MWDDQSILYYSSLKIIKKAPAGISREGGLKPKGQNGVRLKIVQFKRINSRKDV